jgi:hypothetical protein
VASQCSCRDVPGAPLLLLLLIVTAAGPLLPVHGPVHIYGLVESINILLILTEPGNLLHHVLVSIWHVSVCIIG